MLFHTITPEYDRLPLKRLHSAFGTNRFLFVTDLKLEAVLLSVISRIKNIHSNRQEPNCFVLIHQFCFTEKNTLIKRQHIQPLKCFN